MLFKMKSRKSCMVNSLVFSLWGDCLKEWIKLLEWVV